MTRQADRATTFEACRDALLESYAFEAILGTDTQATPERSPDVNAVIARLEEAEWRTGPGMGEGEDASFTDDSLSACALVLDGCGVIHLQALARARHAGVSGVGHCEIPVPRRPTAGHSPAAVPGGGSGVRCPGCGFLYATSVRDGQLTCGHCGWSGAVGDGGPG